MLSAPYAIDKPFHGLVKIIKGPERDMLVKCQELHLSMIHSTVHISKCVEPNMNIRYTQNTNTNIRPR